MPAYNERIHSRSKPRGLPEVGQQAPTHHPPSYDPRSQSLRNVDTPYRLPRLYGLEASRAGSGISQPHEFLSPTPELQHKQNTELMRMSGSPLKVPIKASFDYPRLKHAIIAPKQTVAFTRSGRPQHLPQYDRSSHVASRVSRTADCVARPQTALSDTGSVHWALGSSLSVHFDRMGGSRYQGPYSRTFTKTCVAPQNWLRMRLGFSQHRSNTQIFSAI